MMTQFHLIGKLAILTSILLPGLLLGAGRVSAQEPTPTPPPPATPACGTPADPCVFVYPTPVLDLPAPTVPDAVEDTGAASLWYLEGVYDFSMRQYSLGCIPMVSSPLTGSLTLCFTYIWVQEIEFFPGHAQAVSMSLLPLNAVLVLVVLAWVFTR